MRDGQAAVDVKGSVKNLRTWDAGVVGTGARGRSFRPHQFKSSLQPEKGWTPLTPPQSRVLNLA